MILALYDCRSKQEYIYRTNRIRQISGASQILTSVYSDFCGAAAEYGIRIINTWREDIANEKSFSAEEFAASGMEGVVLYEGGGNLFILYRDKDVCLRANRILSRMLLERTYSVTAIAAYTEVTGDFAADRERLYHEKQRVKNLGAYSVPCNVLPFTLIDRQTFLPIVSRKNGAEMTADALPKERAYQMQKDAGGSSDVMLNEEELDRIIKKKGDDSLLAIIYIDGNDMGSKVKACTEGLSGYAESVDALRSFSVRTDRLFVQNPLRAIEECLHRKNQAEQAENRGKQRHPHSFRKVIGGGDEITLICRAEDAADIVTAYFSALTESEPLTGGIPNAACAGIAVFHSHAPFADVYEIAEACCESGKKVTRASGSTKNYIDFHFCHSGITNSLDIIREKQEQRYTARPYSLEDFRTMQRIGAAVSEIGRGNVKSLGDAVTAGEAAFETEKLRLLSRFGDGSFAAITEEFQNDPETLRRNLYDIYVMYDVWFAKGGAQNA